MRLLNAVFLKRLCGSTGVQRAICVHRGLNPLCTLFLFREVLLNARQRVAVHVNTELLSTYWNIGKIIVEHEQSSKERADYGKQTLKQLSKDLTKEFGKGFSVSNLQFMRRFYQCYQIQQTVSVKLSWSHYCELLSISDTDKRSFYEKEAVNSGWSVRGFMFVGTRQRMEQKNRYIKNGRSSHIIIAAAPVFCRCR